MVTTLLRSLVLVLVLNALTGCAHSYYYLPEIEGDAAIHGRKGGIIYTIPAQGQAELTMRVRALGIRKVHNIEMLGMRMSFVRPPGSIQGVAGNREFVDPTEQLVRIGDRAIKPAFVHSKAKKQSVIELNGGAHEVIEFLYPLSKESDGAISTMSYAFEWKVHYGQGKSEQQVARFDRYDAAPQQAAELYPEDPDYPYDVSPMDMPGWTVVRDPFWWAVDPWWPWR